MKIKSLTVDIFRKIDYIKSSNFAKKKNHNNKKCFCNKQKCILKLRGSYEKKKKRLKNIQNNP